MQESSLRLLWAEAQWLVSYLDGNGKIGSMLLEVGNMQTTLRYTDTHSHTCMHTQCPPLATYTAFMRKQIVRHNMFSQIPVWLVSNFDLATFSVQLCDSTA